MKRFSIYPRKTIDVRVTIDRPHWDQSFDSQAAQALRKFADGLSDYGGQQSGRNCGEFELEIGRGVVAKVKWRGHRQVGERIIVWLQEHVSQIKQKLARKKLSKKYDDHILDGLTPEEREALASN